MVDFIQAGYRSRPSHQRSGSERPVTLETNITRRNWSTSYSIAETRKRDNHREFVRQAPTGDPHAKWDTVTSTADGSGNEGFISASN